VWAQIIERVPATSTGWNDRPTPASPFRVPPTGVDLPQKGGVGVPLSPPQLA
jgi:hypothetical protein